MGRAIHLAPVAKLAFPWRRRDETLGRMSGWTDQARDEGRLYATRILAELVELRDGGDPVGARLLIDEAAAHHATGTIAQALAMAESLIHRLANASGETEQQVLQDFLKETAGNRSRPELFATPAISKPRRLRRASRSA
jgi:hypothetical protein